MSVYLKQINLLKSNTKTLNNILIDVWLKNNETLLNEAIDNSICYKWKKWRNDTSLHIFPCISHLCGLRNEECRFVEFYKLLLHYLQTIKSEQFYAEQLKSYKIIKHNKKAIFEWIINIREYGDELIFIKKDIYFKDENNKNLISFEMNYEANSNLWKFKSLFEEYIYSLEFEEYEK
jgi:hypothetical protein